MFEYDREEMRKEGGMRFGDDSFIYDLNNKEGKEGYLAGLINRFCCMVFSAEKSIYLLTDDSLGDFYWFKNKEFLSLLKRKSSLVETKVIIRKNEEGRGELESLLNWSNVKRYGFFKNEISEQESFLRDGILLVTERDFFKANEVKIGQLSYNMTNVAGFFMEELDKLIEKKDGVMPRGLWGKIGKFFEKKEKKGVIERSLNC